MPDEDAGEHASVPASALTGPLWAWTVALALVAVVTVYRILYAGTTDLIADEAYYWEWSRRLQWCYFDQPPVVAVLIRLATFGAGGDPRLVRLPATLLWAGTALLTGRLALEIWRSRWAGLLAVVLVLTTPVLAVNGVLMVHDAPFCFFWVAALFALWRARLTDSWGAWVAVGAAAGLALLSKFTAVVLLPLAALFLTLSPERKRLWTSPRAWAAVSIALVLFSPAVAWNAANDWASLKHITGLGSRADLGTRHVGDYLGGQALLATPFLLLALLGVWGAHTRAVLRRDESPRSEGIRLLWAFSVPLFLIFLVLSLRSKIEANWPMPVYLAGSALLAGVIVRWLAAAPKTRAGGVALIVLGPLLGGFLSLLTLHPTGMRAIVVASGGDWEALDRQHLPRNWNRTNDAYGWSELATRVERLRRVQPDAPFVASPSYQLVSALAFELTGSPRVVNLPVNRRYNQYDYWPQPEARVGRAAVIVLNAKEDVPSQLRALSLAFSDLRPLDDIVIRRPELHSEPVRRLLVYRGEAFRGMGVFPPLTTY